MNPLGRGNTLSPQLQQNIQQIKALMHGGTPQNNMLQQVMQMCQGRNPETIFRSMCQQRGIDPDAVLRELQN